MSWKNNILFLDQDPETMPIKRWIRFLHEPMTNIETAKPCMALGDINGDGENKLVLVDFATNQCRLKLLKGLTLVTDTFLPDEPAGVVTFMEENATLPSIAVAVGSSILIYRNMKPYYRCNIESMDLDPSELQLWKGAKEGSVGAEQLFEGLQVRIYEYKDLEFDFQLRNNILEIIIYIFAYTNLYLFSVNRKFYLAF